MMNALQHGAMPMASPPRSFEPFYFGEAERKLFGIYHRPLAERRRGNGLLLCYPFGQEYIRCHRSLRQLAVRAAHAGFPVLRFDYYGCGDSMGRREDGSVRQWLNDVSTSIAEIRRRGRVSSVCLVGLRFGATLAMLAAAERGDIAGLVLWDPIVDGRRYIQELAAGPKRRRGARPSTEALGFPLTADLSAEIARISLDDVSRRPASHVLVIDSGPEPSDPAISNALARVGARVATRNLPSPPIWTDEQNMLVPSAILQSIVGWTSEEFP